ncbi:MAG: hypothetical protein ACJ8GN_00040 [Longimicrobiaceae bacterium]
MPRLRPLPPPHPKLVVRIGVTGHRRPNQLPRDTSQLEGAVTRVLDYVRSLAEEVARPGGGYEGEPRLVLVSPLAEGADRLVARIATDRKYELEVPLPFAEDEYLKDFRSARSKAEFRALREQAESVLELDGRRDPPGERGNGGVEDLAYARAGSVVIQNSEVVLAVWNGTINHKVGGTGEVVAEALRQQVPVVQVPTQAPHEPVLVDAITRNGVRTRPLEDLAKLLLGTLERPSTPDHPWYFRRIPILGWSPPLHLWFRKLLGVRTSAAGSEPSPKPAWSDFHWADALANFYGNFYRSAYVTVYLLGAVAVWLALLSLHEAVFAEIELAVIAAIMLVILAGRYGHWHDRWLNHRLLAEQFRQAELLVPLGRTGAWFRGLVAPLTERPGEPWTTWLFRARVREARLAHTSLTGEELEGYRARLLDVISAQRTYHENNHKALERLEHRLHGLGTLLFILTFFACVLHLAAGSVFPEVAREAWEYRLVVFAAVFPALGGALAAIASHGEFRRIARRSEAMANRLRALEQRAQGLRNPTSDEAAEVAESATQLMTAELLDWHVMLLERPLVLPG